LFASCAALSACTSNYVDIEASRGALFDPNTGHMVAEGDDLSYMNKITTVRPPDNFPWPRPWPRQQRRTGTGTPLNQTETEIIGDPAAGHGLAVRPDGEVLFIRSASGGGPDIGILGNRYALAPSATPIPVQTAANLASATRGDTLSLNVDSSDTGETLTLTFADRWSTLAGRFDPFEFPELAFSARAVNAKVSVSEPLLALRVSGPRDEVIAFAAAAGITEIRFLGRVWDLDDVQVFMRSPAVRGAVASLLGE
jgi:hypothetical protein